MTAPVLEMRGIVVRAGGHTILDLPSFAIDARETVALFGPNGAGKSTLLHIAALLQRPDAGEVTILGEQAAPRTAVHLRRKLAVVFQDPLLFDVAVLDNAAAGLHFQGMSRAEAREIALAWLERFGVAHLAARKSRSLSGGEAARVALARAFATAPAVLLLDEPFSALDAPTRDTLLPMLRDRLRDSGAAALLVTHELAEAFAFADRVCLIENGRILASGDPRALLARPPSRRAAELLGVENILRGTVHAVDGSQVQVVVDPVGPMLRARPFADAGVKPGDRCTIAIPAGAVRVDLPNRQTRAGWNSFRARVVATSAHALGTRIVAETPAPLVALAHYDHDQPRWAMGDDVCVSVAVAAVHLILETPGELAAIIDDAPTRDPTCHRWLRTQER